MDTKLNSHYLQILGNLHKTKSPIMEFSNTVLEKNGNKLHVIVEYDESHAAYGIYYGIQAENNNFTFNFSEENKIGDYFLANFWRQENQGVNNVNERNIFLKSDNTDVNRAYWPLWIRLEDWRPLDYAINGAKALVKALESLGYTKCP